MKKSILTIALAVMMLVAFTACEQQVPNVLPDDVNYITIVQTEDAVEGKAFDPSLFNVMVYSSNPNVAPVTVSGKGYVSLTDSEAKTFAPEQKVTATYAGKTASPLAVSVAEVLDVKVEGFPESVVKGASMLKTSTLTASVTLSNGTELELGADDYTIWYDVNANVTAEDEEGTPVTAKVFFDIDNAGTPVLSKTVANLKVTKDTSNDPKAIEKKEVDELSVKWTITGVDGKTRTEDTAEITVYAGESVTYTLYGGIEEDETGRPLYEMKSGDYALSLDTLSNVIGKAFGANDINATNQKINEIGNKTILTSLSDIGLSEFTTLDAIVTAVPNGKTLQLYLSDANASILYGTSGGTGNLPTNIAGLLTIQRNSENNWVYITYKTNLSVFENEKAGIFYTTKFTGYRAWTRVVNNMQITELYTGSVASTTTVTMNDNYNNYDMVVAFVRADYNNYKMIAWYKGYYGYKQNCTIVQSNGYASYGYIYLNSNNKCTITSAGVIGLTNVVLERIIGINFNKVSDE